MKVTDYTTSYTSLILLSVKDYTTAEYNSLFAEIGWK